MSAISDLSDFFSTHPLTRDAPLSAWARFVGWQLKSRVGGEIIVPWIEGQRLAVRRGMRGVTGNIYVGLHEFADMMLPLHFLREGDLFLDIGANVGSYTVLAAGVRRAQVWAFEPDPGTARALRRNIELNGLGTRVLVHELALGEVDGEAAFTTGLDTINRVTTEAGSATRRVVMRKLDTLIGDALPVMIKMDIEGHEEPAIRGAMGVLGRPSLKVIEIETVSAEIEQTFVAHGFSRYRYDPFTRSLTASAEKGASNTVFVRDPDHVAARLAAAPRVTVLGRSI